MRPHPPPNPRPVHALKVDNPHHQGAAAMLLTSVNRLMITALSTAAGETWSLFTPASFSAAVRKAICGQQHGIPAAQYPPEITPRSQAHCDTSQDAQRSTKRK